MVPLLHFYETFRIAGGSRSPGGDPLFAALLSWKEGPGRPLGRLLLDAPLMRVRSAVADRDGREVKHTGDGLLVSFTSVTGAVECAVDIHRRLEEARGDEPERSVNVRIGVSAGEPVSGSDDLYGAAVNLAARICAHAQPQQTLVSGAVRDLSIGKNVTYRDVGVVALKGFPEPVQLYEVPWTL